MTENDKPDQLVATKPSAPVWAESNNALVLIAEDEPEIAAILEAYLVREGFRTVHAKDGRVALELHQALKPDVVLLDVKMPHLDGWEVLARIRGMSDTPILMVTALRVGADDYVVKPFNPAEVAARVRAILRRVSKNNRSGVLRIGDLRIDLESHLAYVAQEDKKVSLSLTLTEFRLLTYIDALADAGVLAQ